jgi:hypothetical protein
MAAGDPASAGLDHGTAALRRLMVRAAEDDAARDQALAAVMQRPVLVATWPHSPDSVRTLTNSDGEQAMPLFTGADALQDAARRFGWASPDGSVSHRAIDAVEAMRGAIANAVHFVVLDICADHSVEFARDEIETALRDSATHAARVEPPPAPAAPPAQPQPAIAEGDAGFGRERTTGLTAIIEQSVNRGGRGTRPDPRAEPSVATTLAVVAVARVAVPIGSRATLAGTPALGALRRPERVPTPPAMDAVQPPAIPARGEPRSPTPPPFAAVQPEPRAAAPQTPPAFDAIGPTFPPEAQAPAFAAPSAPQIELPSLDASDGFRMAEAPLDGGFDFGLASEEPEAKPAALEAAAMMQQIGKMAGDAATQQAAAEVATMLKQMAMKGSVEEEKPSAAQNAAKALAAMLMGSAAASAQPAQAAPVEAPAAPRPAPAAPAHAPASKGKRSKAKGEARPASSATMKAVSVPEPASDCVLGPLETPLDDGLLNTISDGLRKYPEVEWACEVSDGTAVAVIGVRVAPGFMTNVPEIKSAIVRAGEGHRTRLSVLILSDAQQMKEARSQGSVFFPWRKKGKR